MKPERDGLKLPAPAVPALPPPLPREDERVSSSRALPSTALVYGEVASFKGLSLAGVRKKRKQRENPHSVGVTPLPPVDPSQERRVKRRRDHSTTIASDPASSDNKVLKVYFDLLTISSIII